MSEGSHVPTFDSTMQLQTFPFDFNVGLYDLCCLNTFLFALQTSTFTHGSDALDLSDGLYDSDAILDLHIPEGIASRGGL